MKFTPDELVVIIESLREYRLRIADASRRVLCDALIFRCGSEIIRLEKESFSLSSSS